MRLLPRLARSCIVFLFAVCPLLFFTDLTRNPYYTQIALLNIVVCAFWIVWLADGFREGVLRWSYTALDLPLLAFIGFTGISWGAAMVSHRAFITPIYSEGSKAIIFLIVNAYLVYAAALRVRERPSLRNLLWIAYAVATAASVYGLAQYFGTEWFWPHNLNPYGSRPVSTFGNPNFLSSYLVVIAPVMVADLLFSVTGMPRIFLFAGSLSVIGALLATLTRSSWAGLVVGLAVVAVGSRSMPERQKMDRRWIGLFLGVVAALVVFWPKGGPGAYSETVFGRLAEIRHLGSKTYGPVHQRLLIWLCAWQMAFDHPFSGQGWGCFELFYPFYQGAQLLEPFFRGLRTHANNAHNDILEHWAQVGTVGFGLYLLIWVTYFRMAISVVRRTLGPWRAIVLGFIAGVAGMLVDNLLNVSVHFAVPALLFWWWVGATFAQDPDALRTVEVSTAPLRNKLGAGLAGVALVLLMLRAGALWAGEVHFFKGFKLSKAGQNLEAARIELEKAYAWHHLEVNNTYELANVYARMGNREKAIEFYGKALEANAGYDEIYFNRATVLMRAGQVDEAIKNYRLSLSINPASHDSYAALAGLLMKDIARHSAAAEACYKQAVKMFPLDKDFWNNLGYLYTQQSQWEEAYNAYRKAIEADPEFDLARRNIQIVARHLPQHANDVVLRIDREWADMERLGVAHQYDEAIRRGRVLEAGFPRSLRTRLLIGNFLFQANRLEEAAAEYELAIQLHGNAASLWQNLGVVRTRLNQPEKARAAFERALQLDPQNTMVRGALGR